MAIKHRLKHARPNRNDFHPSFDKAGQCWTNPLDGKTYSVAHLRPFFIDVPYTKNDEKRSVRARVSFSVHCYTRERKHLDDPELTVVTETVDKRKAGRIRVDRVFDEARWIYSNGLPKLMANIQNMSCKRDDDNQVVIHFAPRNNNRPAEGWYTFVRIQVDPKYPDVLQLEVRTTHRRIDHPSSSRYPIRFNQHLATLLDD